eukprot:Skav222497  [mRNA]  locus=scaffold1835:669488:672655:+ [translate_table: standard]
MTRETHPIPKRKGLVTAQQIRPISVLPQLYRLWARVVSACIISAFARTFSVDITGYLPGRGAMDASYQFQAWIEQARANQVDMVGLSIDLLKCFNTIRRSRVIAMMKRLGIDDKILRQWDESLLVSQRIWCIGSAVSSPIPAPSGCPEGDPISVAAMLTVAYCWTLALRGVTDNLKISAYADNWGWASGDLRNMFPTNDTTCRYTDIMGMTVDWSKSWLWSTDKTLQDQFHAYMAQHDLPSIAHHLHQMDLGCQLTYRGPPRLGDFRSRLEEGEHRLQRLENLHVPIDVKAHVVQAGIWPQVFYGVELLPLGVGHIDHLRSRAATAILGPSRSRNSAVAMSVIPKVVDPMVAVLQRVLKQARRYLLQASALESDAFLKIASRHTTLTRDCQGPAGVLAYFLSLIGWQIDGTGSLHMFAHFSARLVDLSTADLMKFVALAWQENVFPYHTDRRAWKGLPPICRSMTCKLLQKFTPSQQKQIIAEISGSFQTRSQQAKWDAETTPECQWCHQHDDRAHRFYDCLILDDLRASYEGLHSHIQDQGWLFHDMPVIYTDPTESFLRMMHWTHPEPSVDPAVLQHLRHLETVGHPLQIYTDGSCQFPTDAGARFASYAVVVDVAVDDSQRCHAAHAYLATKKMPNTFQPLIAAQLRGEQAIPRAELQAVVWVCEHFQHACLRVDSQCTLDLVDRCQKASTPLLLAHLGNWDLVRRLWFTQQHGSHTFLKIKAHSENDTSLSLLDLYRALGNKAVNDLAEQACKTLNLALTTEASQLFHQRKEQSDCLLRTYHFFLDSYKRRAELDARQPDSNPHQLQSVNKRQSNIDAFSGYDLTVVWEIPLVRVNMVHGTAWGATIGNSILLWLNKLRWPVGEDQHELQQLGVTWLELVLSWMLESKLWLPIKRVHTDGHEYLIPLSDSHMARAYDVKFSELAHTMSKLVLQISTLHMPSVIPSIPRAQVKSLYVLGARYWQAGFQWRPVFPHQAEVVRLLDQNIRQQEGRNFDKLPSGLDFVTDLAQMNILRQELSDTWTRKTAACHQLAKQVRDMTKSGQRQLSFSAT